MCYEQATSGTFSPLTRDTTVILRGPPTLSGPGAGEANILRKNICELLKNICELLKNICELLKNICELSKNIWSSDVQYANVGQGASLWCQATAVPRILGFTWSFNGQELGALAGAGANFSIVESQQVGTGEVTSQ